MYISAARGKCTGPLNSRQYGYHRNAMRVTVRRLADLCGHYIYWQWFEEDANYIPLVVSAIMEGSCLSQDINLISIPVIYRNGKCLQRSTSLCRFVRPVSEILLCCSSIKTSRILLRAHYSLVTATRGWGL